MEYHVKVLSSPVKAVDLLSTESGLSKANIKLAMQKGCVWLTTKYGTQRLRRHAKVLETGWELHCYYNPDVLNAEVPSAELIADEGSYSIWNKPCGMLSQGSRWGDHCTVYRWAEQHLKPERTSFIVHRLDRAANGLIIVAHKKSIAAKLSRMFENKTITKKYHATVIGKVNLEAGRLTINDPVDDKSACTHIQLLNYDKERNESFLDIQIETGRKHQIRKHLSTLGHPIVGDRLYGRVDDNLENIPNLKLTAYNLSFICPEHNKLKTWELGKFG